MLWALLITMVVGMSTVLQGGFNQKLAERWDLSGAVFLNGFVFFLASGVLLALSRFWPHLLPDVFQGKGAYPNFAWWHAIPGIFGFLIVAGIPWALPKMGAVKFFVLLIVVQMVVSMLWDLWVVERPIPTLRIIGTCIAALGAVLASLDN